MKKFITVLMLAMLSFSIFADTYTLSAKQNEDGEIVVSNAKGRVQDRVTGSSLLLNMKMNWLISEVLQLNLAKERFFRAMRKVHEMICILK